jgi:hypothetical protein
MNTQAPAAPSAPTAPAENASTVETPQAGQTPLPTTGAEAVGAVSGESEFASLLQKGEDDPGYEYSGDELDKISNFRAKGMKVPELKAKAEAPVDTVDATKPAAQPANELSPILEAFGVKDAKELPDAVKRVQASNENLSRATRNQDLLFQDLRAGKPEAVAFFEKNFGGKFVPNGQAAQPAQQAGQPAQAEAEISLPAEMFISDDAHKQANAAFAAIQSQIKEIKSSHLEWKNEKENYSRAQAQAQAQAESTDTLVSISERMGDKFSREEINAWIGGKENPKMAAYDELFDLAKKHGSDLEGAFLIRQGQKAAQAVIDAEKRGREQAYGQKTTPPLSAAQGKGNTTYAPITQADIQAYESGEKQMPDEWFDKGNKPVKEKIPASMHSWFGFNK